MTRSKPRAQGALDGLCGPYAIVNALMHIGHRGDPAELFQTACSAVSARRWPELLWEGTWFGDLKKMLAACMRKFDGPIGVKVSYPFWRTPPTTNDGYWIEFDRVFDDEDVLCGIVGITRPSDHWLVIARDGQRIVFYDSEPLKPMKRVNRTSLYAGVRGPKTKKWVIDRRELVVFRRTD